MTADHLASWIIIWAAVGYLGYCLGQIIVEIAESVSRVRRRRDHDRQRIRFVAARVAAREECEARMRAAGYWDNYEIQAAMDRAGEAAAPGYRP